MEVWYIFWILAGVGDPLPELAPSRIPDISTNSKTTIVFETFTSEPTPQKKFYQGLESPAGLNWLQSPAITAMPGGSTSKKRVCLPDVSEVDSDPTFPGLIGLGNCNYFVWVSFFVGGEQLNPLPHIYTLPCYNFVPPWMVF